MAQVSPINQTLTKTFNFYYGSVTTGIISMGASGVIDGR